MIILSGTLDSGLAESFSLAEIVLSVQSLSLGRFVPPQSLVENFLKKGLAKIGHQEIFYWNSFHMLSEEDYLDLSAELVRRGLKKLAPLGPKRKWAWQATMLHELTGEPFVKLAKFLRISLCIEGKILDAQKQDDQKLANRLHSLLIRANERFG